GLLEVRGQDRVRSAAQARRYRHEIRRSGERVRRVGRVGRLRISLILLLAAAAATLVFRARITRSNPELIVGVLEDIPPHYAGQSNSREVRVLLRKSNDAWTAFPSNCPDESCLRQAPSAF